MSSTDHLRSGASYGLTDIEWDLHAISSVMDPDACISENAYREARSTESLEARVPNQSPPWLRSTVDQLENALRLQENWDSYGAVPILFENAEYAVRLLDFVMTAGAPPPFITPTPEGSIQLEWHRFGIDLEVEILAPYRLLVSYEDATCATVDWEGEISTDLTKVREAIQELTRRT